MDALPNLEKAFKPPGIIQHGNRDVQLRWVSKDAIEVGKYYYIFFRTFGREIEPGLPEEQSLGVWLIGKVIRKIDIEDYPLSYKINFEYALRKPLVGSASGNFAPPEYEALGYEGEGRLINFSHIQSPSETGLPPERTVARFFVPINLSGGRRRTGRRRHHRKKTIRRRRV